MFKIYSSKYTIEAHNFVPGQIITKNDFIAIATTNGFIQPNEIQMEGKKKMTIREFMNGFSFADATIAD